MTVVKLDTYTQIYKHMHTLLSINYNGCRFLQRTLSSLELSRVVSIANRASLEKPDTSISSLDSERSNGASYDGASSSNFEYSRRPKKSHDPARDISIQVLEKFSLVTKFARETTSQLFRESHSDGLNAYEKKQQNVPSVDKKIVSDVTPVALDPLEVKYCSSFDQNFQYIQSSLKAQISK